MTRASTTRTCRVRAPLLIALVGLSLGGTPAVPADDGYVFPIDADHRTMSWDEEHWDGTLAVDIWVHPEYPADAPERAAFYEARVLAVTSGTASRLDNPRGGIAVLLHGDDGRTYYFAHLSESEIDEPRRVARGEPLGRIGRTGTWTQFLEPHLHLSIANGIRRGTAWAADVDPVFWLEQHFGLTPVRAVRNAYPRSDPAGAPLFGRYRIVEDFRRTLESNPLLAGVLLESTYPRDAAIRAPLTGRVRIHGDTVLGTRIQITNTAGGWSVLLSGGITPLVRSGEIAYRDAIVGQVTGPLHYMLFQGGEPVDPLATGASGSR